jgi:uncharacterized protein YndB with AHSA1/START domain
MTSEPIRTSASSERDEQTLIERDVTIPASREIVWTYWTDPERLIAWMGSTARLDVRPGGELHVEYANGAVMDGEFVEVEEPGRLEFTWGWLDPAEVVRPGASRVEVSLDEAEGGTRVLLRHLGLPASERDSHAEGWDYFLARLAAAVA